jgi:hypothetical protein
MPLCTVAVRLSGFSLQLQIPREGRERLFQRVMQVQSSLAIHHIVVKMKDQLSLEALNDQ